MAVMIVFVPIHFSPPRQKSIHSICLISIYISSFEPDVNYVFRLDLP